MGGKGRQGKWICYILLNHRQANQTFVEPFCGACNIVSRMTQTRIAADANPYLIAMWKAIQNGWLPNCDLTADEYYYMMRNKSEFDPAQVGFSAIAHSFSGVWSSGYARAPKKPKFSFGKSALKTLILIKPKLVGVQFIESDYQDLTIPDHSLIYCDPPYRLRRGYQAKFVTKEFWDWCDVKVEQGHSVFVSELTAPDHWRKIWEGNHTLTVRVTPTSNPSDRKKPVVRDCLFVSKQSCIVGQQR